MYFASNVALPHSDDLDEMYLAVSNERLHNATHRWTTIDVTRLPLPQVQNATEVIQSLQAMNIHNANPVPALLQLIKKQDALIMALRDDITESNEHTRMLLHFAEGQRYMPHEVTRPSDVFPRFFHQHLD